MQNIFIKISVILLVMLITITSCKKDNMVQTPANDDEMMLRNKKVLSLINRFDEKMKSSFKSGEMIELDSVVWNTEALQNYNYAIPDSATKNFVVFKSNYTLNVDANGMVMLDDVQSLYNEMETDYQANFNTIQSDEKLMHFTDVALDSVVGSTAYLSSVRGFGYTWLLNMYWGFSEDDDWIWGYDQGKCDGTEVGVSDGSNELQWRLNNPICIPVNTIIYTDLETLIVHGLDFEDDNGNQRIFFGWDYPNNECLTNDTLTYFLIEADDIINTYQADGGLRPPGKSFVSIDILDDLLMGSQHSWHCHRYDVTFGIYTDIGQPY